MAKLTPNNTAELMHQNDICRLMFENHTAAMLVIDPANGAILSANQAAEQFYGYSPGTLSTMNIADLSNPTDQQVISGMVGAIGDERTCFEFPHKLSSGEIRTVEVHSAKIINGERQLLFSVIHDITERKLAELSLRMSEDRYRRITESITDYIFTVRVENGEAVETHHGPGCQAVTGYSEEEFFADQYLWLRMVPEEDHPVILEQARLVLKGESTAGVEHRIRRKDGQVRWVRNSPVIRRDAEGVLYSYDGLIQDITERKRAEDKLIRSEQELKSLLELLPVGVVWYDTGSNIKYVNRNFVEQFGYDQEEIPTINDWLIRAYPDSSYRESLAGARGNSSAAAQQAGSAIPAMETYVTCKDGKVKHVIINSQQTSSRTIEIFTDLTERDRILSEQIKTQKLESLGVLAGGIAHDFNNILTAIAGNISFAQIFLDPAHESCKPLQEAAKASKRAAELALQLLTFAKGGQPVIKTVSPGRILEESVSLALRGSNVKAELHVPENLRLIKVDEGQISQVFNNVIINAVQAMPEGGRITLSAENITIETDNCTPLEPGDYVKFIFSDEGCGISEEIQKKIFDPYFTTKPGGTGLGLASVHSIVTKHRGHVAVHSEPGKGSVFEIVLPASRETGQEAFAELGRSRLSQTPGCSVLVMDDEEMIREMATTMLGHLGYKVETCARGEEAISRYISAARDGRPYAAVIMDLTVPGGMGGKEAAQQILSFDPSAHLLVSSGYSNDPVMANYMDFGFLAAVKKPYKINEIALALRCVIIGSETASRFPDQCR